MMILKTCWHLNVSMMSQIMELFKPNAQFSWMSDSGPFYSYSLLRCGCMGGGDGDGDGDGGRMLNSTSESVS